MANQDENKLLKQNNLLECLLIIGLRNLINLKILL
jgi:hypothetical protein